LGTAPILVLVVDDYKPWNSFVSTTLRREPQLQIIGYVSDGLDAVQHAERLQPNLILMDIGLPTLNGIEAARRIRAVSPTSKILFVSENRSFDVAHEALSTGAGGYVVKSDAGSELLPAIKAVLEGKRFVSASLAGDDLARSSENQTGNQLQHKKVLASFRAQKESSHKVEFYADDTKFVDGFARFIETALKAGNAVIVVATESHHANLLRRLTADGLDTAAKIEQGSYVPLDVADTLSRFMVNDSVDPILFGRLAEDLITKVTRSAKGEHRRVAVCGEGVHTLLAAGNLDATMKLERMWDEIAQRYDVAVMCGYFRSTIAGENISTLERICAEHSAEYGRELCY
jgi:DNA-binding NarL/FixJ family response regulator